jgi:hypothetical protein
MYAFVQSSLTLRTYNLPVSTLRSAKCQVVDQNNFNMLIYFQIGFTYDSVRLSLGCVLLVMGIIIPTTGKQQKGGELKASGRLMPTPSPNDICYKLEKHLPKYNLSEE